MNAFEPGMTCRLGKSKTGVQWEIIHFDTSSLTVQLSKLGGDGYTNRWAKCEELNDLQPRLLPVTLAACLAWQRQVKNAAKNLEDKARFFNSATDCVARGKELATFTEAFQKAVNGYQAGIAEHYPHLIQKEN